MKHTKGEILNALKIIKEECESSDGCRDCCLRYDEGCCSLDTNLPPMDWDLVSDDDCDWKAFI